MNWRSCIVVTLLLATVCVCLWGYVLNSQSEIFREFQAALLSVEWMLLVCLAIWCGTFIFLTFSRKDWPLIGLLLTAIFAYFVSYAGSSRAPDAIILLAGVTIGKGTQFLLKADGRCKMEDGKRTIGDEVTSLTSKHRNKLETSYVVSYFLIGLVVLLAFSSWWHLDVAHNFYPGTRWTGLWNNPNDYGMLMGAGVTLAIGLLAASLKSKVQSPKSAESAEENKIRDSRNLPLRIFLFIAAGIMAVGLFFSYSRGAWVGTAIGLLYLAKAHGKFKWRFILPGILVVAAAVGFFWHSTADTDQWYLKRLDFSRPSAQHRVSAWRGALQMMRDHPLGVGWNNAVGIYEKNYSPPEGGAAALTMNSYLMLGTELGLPGLICFISYVALRLRSPKSKVQSPKSQSARGDARPTTLDIGHRTLDSTQVACRAGALMLLVAFWFDGGLFTLATASVFWILLELGTGSETGVGRLEIGSEKMKSGKSEIVQKSEVGPPPLCSVAPKLQAKAENRKSEILPSGFTLVEMLVVIAVIAILAALLLPVLSKAKMKGAEAACLNNQKQLALAWHMYADDNGGKVVNFSTYNPPSSVPLDGKNTPWRTGLNMQLVVTVPAGYSPEQAYIYKIEMGYQQPSPTVAGPLFKYAPNPHIVHCPGDKRYNLPIGQGFCWDSYSGVALLNGEGGGFTKENQIMHPSDRFLWAEGADGRGENQGSWWIGFGTATNNFSDARFGDSPAAFHVASGTFNFADGHAESHRWLDGTTLAYANSTATDKESNGDGTQAAAQEGSVYDQQWVGSHYPGPQNP